MAKRDVWFWTEALYAGSCDRCGACFPARERIAYNARRVSRLCEVCGMGEATEDAYLAMCPRKACGAHGKKPCVDRSGRERKYWHAGRQRAS